MVCLRGDREERSDASSKETENRGDRWCKNRTPLPRKHLIITIGVEGWRNRETHQGLVYVCYKLVAHTIAGSNPAPSTLLVRAEEAGEMSRANLSSYSLDAN